MILWLMQDDSGVIFVKNFPPYGLKVASYIRVHP